jgi:phage-related baseplate assembly protein
MYGVLNYNSKGKRFASDRPSLQTWVQTLRRFLQDLNEDEILAVSRVQEVQDVSRDVHDGTQINGD